LLGEIETFGAAMAFKLSKFHSDLKPATTHGHNRRCTLDANGVRRVNWQERRYLPYVSLAGMAEPGARCCTLRVTEKRY
jgi:hypothetical protein